MRIPGLDRRKELQDAPGSKAPAAVPMYQTNLGQVQGEVARAVTSGPDKGEATGACEGSEPGRRKAAGQKRGSPIL